MHVDTLGGAALLGPYEVQVGRNTSAEWLRDEDDAREEADEDALSFF
jgi:hypothetical protein